jgi:phenylalanyl-tRNA synthetase alpha chain
LPSGKAAVSWRGRGQAPVPRFIFGFFRWSRKHRMNPLEQIVIQAQADFCTAQDGAALENAKAKYLGKTGQVTEQMKALGKMAPDQRKAQGALINAAKEQVEAALNARRDALANAQMQARLNAEAIDVTLPGRGRGIGGIHPVMRSWQRVEEIFGSIGFDVADGPEIETDWTNFTALNSPENHPARSMQDTFYTSRRSRSSRPDALTVSIAMRRTRRCFIRLKGCGLRKTSALPT